MQKPQAGFTIVELLIVIVVIATLAAISIVAYNGIRTKAENDRTVSVVGDYVKAFKLYQSDNGYLPESNTSTNIYRCLGEFYATGCGGQGTPGCGFGNINNSASFNNLLRQYMSNTSNLPMPSTASYQCPEAPLYGAIYVYRGGSGFADLYYFLQGDNACVNIAGVAAAKSSYTTGITRCSMRVYDN